MTESEFRRLREAMVREQLLARGIADARVLAAMGTVPREEFVPEHLRRRAYDDCALPIAAGQTISQPYVVARMAELAEVNPEDCVLDIGTGSGYGAAILGQLAREVYSIERHGELARAAQLTVEILGYTNIEVRRGDGAKGWPEAAPFQAIVIAAATEDVPKTLLEQLADGGRLVYPQGGHFSQDLVRLRRAGEEFVRETHGAVAFVPLIRDRERR